MNSSLWLLPRILFFSSRFAFTGSSLQHRIYFITSVYHIMFIVWPEMNTCNWPLVYWGSTADFKILGLGFFFFFFFFLLLFTKLCSIVHLFSQDFLREEHIGTNSLRLLSLDKEHCKKRTKATFTILHNYWSVVCGWTQITYC